MEFRLLGPLDVVEDGRTVRIAGKKPRALLTVLLLNANRTVSRDRLIDDLWGETPPATATKTLQNYVAQLRKAVGAELLVTHGSGYAIELRSEQLDLRRFLDLVDQGRRALSPDGWNPERAAAVLRDALSLWRGDPFPEFSAEPFASSERARLDELRVSALEDRIEADLALGRHQDLVAELEALVSRHPLRERLRRQLMLALYRSGRQAEALAAYQQARRTLVEELGIEPGRELQHLERAILEHDPALETDRLRATERVDTSAPVSPSREPSETSRRDAAINVTVGDADDGFVGRQREVRFLEQALLATLSGQGRLVMITGEPGIGKSRTAAQIARTAELRAADVLWGSCYEREGAPPYWPWVQALRSLAGKRETQELRDALRSTTQAIVDVVPELRHHVSELEATPTPSDPREARFRLFDSITALLTRAASTRPIVVVLDDLHWADEGSLLLLEFIARELPSSRLMVVGTYRDVDIGHGHPLTETLGELTRQGPLDRIVLGGLSKEDVGHYIKTSTDLKPPPSLVQAIHTQTDGNPLFVTEVLRLLEQDGDLEPGQLEGREAWELRIPPGVREVIARRVDRLSERCNRVLTLAAVIGREFGLDQLEVLVDDHSDQSLLEVLEEALGAGLIQELPGAVDRYQFAHALIKEVLAQELSTARRVRLHAQIAPAIEALYGDDVEAHAAELAHHYVEAESLLGSDKLLHYSRAAGEAALLAHAYEEAVAHFERALAARKGRPMDADQADLLFTLARAELGARELFDVGGVLDHLYAAFDYYAEARDSRRAVEVAAYPLPPIYGPTKAPEYTRRALTLVAPDSLEEGRLLTSSGWFAGTHAADHDGARAAFERSLAIARRLGDSALEQRTLLSAAQVDYWHLDWQGCWEKGSRAVELALARGDAHAEMVSREWPVRSALVRGEQLDEARAHMEVAIELAEKLRERSWLGTTHTVGAVISMLEGDWQSAREVGNEGLALQPREPRNLAIRALIESQAGAVAEGEAYLARLVDPARRAAWGLWDQGAVAAFVPLIARITGAEARFELAEAEALAALSSSAAPFQRELWPRIGLGLIAVQRADPEMAAEHYAWLEHQRGTAVLGTGLAIDRLLGLLAETMSQRDTSAAHFDDALAFCKRAGYRPEYAWSASDYAETLLDQGDPGDREKAIALQDEALAIARALGMQPLVERVLGRRDLL